MQLRSVRVDRPRLTSSHESGLRFRKDIQGLRAIAVILVVLYHVGVPGISGGYIGVDVFFVISGFLISSHLIETYSRTGRISFSEFYARRMRRILPASLIVIVATTVAATCVYPSIALPRVMGDALASTLMVPNFVFANRETDYLADQSPSAFQHYWSLGVEEQFYLLWPIVLLLLIVIARGRAATVISLIAVLIVSSFAVGVLTTYSTQPNAFFLLPSRAWELLVGALVGALVVLLPGRVPKPLAVFGGWFGLVSLLGSAILFDSKTPFPGIAAALPVIATAAVLYFGRSQISGGPSALLSIRPLQFFGAISFALYLVHWPILTLAQVWVGEQDPLQIRSKFLLGFVVATLVAWLLYRFAEEPMRRSSFYRSRAPRVSLLSGVAACVALVVALNVTSAWAQTRDGTLGPAVAAAADTPVELPATSMDAPSNLVPALEDVAVSVSDVYGDGCHLALEATQPLSCTYGNANGAIRIVVFGDSHSAQWLPAVQDFASNDARIRIETHTKSSCPAVDVTVLANQVPNHGCDAWRASVLEQLKQAPADLVIISSASSYDLADIASMDRAASWGEGLRRTVAELAGAGSRVLVIADTPSFQHSPPTCVSKNPRELEACAASRLDVIDSELGETERKAALAAGADYVDLNDYICATGTCPVVIANLLVYRDASHLTVPFVHYLAPALAPRLIDVLGAPGSA